MSKSRDKDYEVGYCRPPKKTQFKKGQSGNPNGRPKRRTDAAGLLEEALSQTLTVQEGDKVIEMSAEEAVMYAQIRKAMQGDVSAFSEILKLAKRLGVIGRASQGSHDRPGGFLVVPDPVTQEEWEKMARKLADEMRSRKWL
jgi:hypothetical protein